MAPGNTYGKFCVKFGCLVLRYASRQIDMPITSGKSDSYRLIILQ